MKEEGTLVIHSNPSFDAVNLNFIKILFPSVTVISINNLSYICSNFLNKVIEFISSKQNTDFWYFGMNIQRKFGKSNIFSQCQIYEHKFNKLGYD